MCEYRCMCVSKTCVYMHVCVWTCCCACVGWCECTHVVGTGMHPVHMWTWVSSSLYVSIWTCNRAQVYKYVCMCAYVHVCHSASLCVYECWCEIMCMCINANMSVCTCMHASACVWVHYANVCIWQCSMCMSSCVYLYICVNVCESAGTYVHVWASLCVYLFICMSVSLHMCACIWVWRCLCL